MTDRENFEEMEEAIPSEEFSFPAGESNLEFKLNIEKYAREEQVE